MQSCTYANCMTSQLTLTLLIFLRMSDISWKCTFDFLYPSFHNTYKEQTGGKNCLLINEFSYKRVSYIRVSIIHNKEGVWPGEKNSLAITEFSYKRVAYNRRVLYYGCLKMPFPFVYTFVDVACEYCEMFAL